MALPHDFAYKRLRVLEMMPLFPFELAKKLIEIARTKSASASFDHGQYAACLAGLDQMMQLGAGKACRWLAHIRVYDGQAKFDSVVKELELLTK